MSRSLAVLVGGALAALGLAAGAAEVPTAAIRSLPAELQLGLEQIRLPGGENLGLAGTRYLLEVAPGVWAGPALFGAASGQRAGCRARGRFRTPNGRWAPRPT